MFFSRILESRGEEILSKERYLRFETRVFLRRVKFYVLRRVIFFFFIGYILDIIFVGKRCIENEEIVTENRMSDAKCSIFSFDYKVGDE